MKIFNFKTGHIATITKYIAILTYILLVLSHIVKQKRILSYINDILSILYGIIWTAGICGFLINNIFYKQMMNRDKYTRFTLILEDIFGHILPLFLIYYYGPTTTHVTFRYYALFIILFTFLFGNYFSKIYVGVPKLLIIVVAPFIALMTFYMRYSYIQRPA